jgi:acetylornithine deacetylase/succinyl-diaminopimelate desuccinylase-like protein
MANQEIPLDQSQLKSAKEFADRTFPQALAQLGDLVKIPGVAWPSFDPKFLEESAQSVKAQLQQLEFFDFVEIRKAAKPDGQLGAPAVVARRAARNGAPHVLLYAHHDVQPPGKDELWDSEPFVATLRGDRLYGRGASDDKSGVITHLFALRGLTELVDSPDVGVTVFIEGEEEAGSPSFQNFLADNKEDLAADLIIVADSGNWSTETPALTASLRGMISQTFSVQTLDHAVHSGLYGGPLPDAMTAMLRLLGTLWDENGNVAIAGLESEPINGPEISLEQLRHESGMLSTSDRMGSHPLAQQLWGEPAATVIGIDAPAVDVSSNTALPSVRARVSVRIAPSQDPAAALEALKSHLVNNAPFGARLEFGDSEAGPGYRAKDGRYAALMHGILSGNWGQQSIDMGIGASIPFIADFAKAFPAAEILVTGVEDPDSRAHSPNESQHLPTLRRAIASETALLIHANSLAVSG